MLQHPCFDRFSSSIRAFSAFMRESSVCWWRSLKSPSDFSNRAMVWENTFIVSV